MRKNRSRPFRDLWRVTCQIWSGTKGIAWEYPRPANTHRKH